MSDKRSLEGKVEGLVKNGRRRFLTPVPTAESFEALNARLEAACLADLDRKASGQSETISSRLEADLAVFRTLPSGAFEACEKRAARVSSTSLVRYRTSAKLPLAKDIDDFDFQSERLS